MATEKKSVSDETMSVLVGLVRTAHGLVHGLNRVGASAPQPYMQNTLPAFETCITDRKYTAEILERVFEEIVYKQGEESRAMIAALRGKVAAIVNDKVAKTLKACAAFDADPDTFEAMGGKRPEATYVPVAAVLGCFPKGTTPEVAVAHLKTMGYTLAKGPSAKEGSRLRIELPKAPVAAPPAHGAEVNAEVDAEIAAENAATDAADDSEDAPVSSQVG
jgi:hypothetical protein